MDKNRVQGIPPLDLVYWELLLGGFTLYVLTEIGFVSFLRESNSGLTSAMYILDCIVLLLYIVDIGVSFRRGYYHKGELILDLLLIKRRYCGWRLIFDILTIGGVALTLVPSLRFNTFRIVVFWKLDSLNQLDNLIFRSLSRYKSLYKITNFLKLSIIYFMFCHYVACIFYSIDLALIDSDYYGENKYSYLWVYNEYLFSPVIALDWPLQYMYAMYYSVETFTTIAYGDCTPKNPIETVFVTFLLVMSTVVFAYLIEEMVVILMASSNVMRFIYLNQVFAIYRYLQLKQVPLNLRYRVKTIFEYLWYQQRFLKSRELSQVIKKLPQKLEGRLISEVFKIYCKKVEFFNRIPDSLFAHMIKIINERIILEGSPLFHPFEQDSCSLYFMEQNNAHYFYKSSKGAKKELVLNNIGFSAFGEVEFFTGMTRALGARVNTQNVLYELRRGEFIADLKSYAMESYEGFCMRGHQLMMNPEHHIFRHCETCLEKTHWVVNCPKVHYVVDLGELITYNNSFENKRIQSLRANRRCSITRVGVSRESRRLLSQRNERNNLRIFIKTFQKYLKEYKAVEEEEYFNECAHRWEKYFPSANLENIAVGGE